MPSNECKRKRVHKPAEEREADILQAATYVFAERGYQVADMQAVADRAEVGKGTLYRYFTSKETLFNSALKYNLALLKKQVDAARLSQREPMDQLREGLRAYLLFFETRPEVLSLFVQERAQVGNSQELTYFSHMLTNKDEWRDLFESIANAYSLRAIDLQDVADACGDLVHGALVLSYSPLPRKPLSQRFDALFDIYLHGIIARD